MSLSEILLNQLKLLNRCPVWYPLSDAQDQSCQPGSLSRGCTRRGRGDSIKLTDLLITTPGIKQVSFLKTKYVLSSLKQKTDKKPDF